MFDNDLLLSFAFMSLLFLRQISILKQPSKINYAPLMVGIGVASSIVHFIIHPEHQDFILLLRESSFPILISLILFVIMNIMHQTVEADQKRVQHEFTKALIDQITQLKSYTSELESKINESQKSDIETRQEFRDQFSNDIKALEAIQINQNKFLDKFDEIELLNKGVFKAFDNFTKVQMPSFDDVVHKHIDILRISEQDHYNKLNSLLQRAVDSRMNMSNDLEEVKLSIENISNLGKDISNTIVKNTISKLASVSSAFETELISLKSHSESLNTSLLESDSKIGTIINESEMLMRQMSLSANKMNEIEEQNTSVHDLYSNMKSLMNDVEAIKGDYVKSQSQLSSLSNELKLSQQEEIDSVKEQMESLIVILTGKIDSSLEKLHKHYHIASEDLSQSVQELTKRAQMKKGYGES